MTEQEPGATEAVQEAGKRQNRRTAEVHNGPDPTSAPVLAQVARYAEIHVEQGRNLDENGTRVGMVDRTWAASTYRVTVDGAQSHTGATRMEDRRDALFEAALVIAAARELAAEFEPGMLHTSVSELYVLPNSPVTIARQMLMNLDLRSSDESVLALAMERLEKRIIDAETDSRTNIRLELTHNSRVVSYQAEGAALGRASAESLGYSHTDVVTVAGHHSTNMKDVVPTVMLFVPSMEGISHNEAEYTRDDDALHGVELLTDVTRRLVRGELEEVQQRDERLRTA